MGLTYKQAGVDIDKAALLTQKIRALAGKTPRRGALGEIGGFGGQICLDKKKYKEPVLVSGADGVGTKLVIAERLRRYDTVGIDLVAMCVNDVLAQGAQPLFFLDYLAMGRLNINKAVKLIKGIAEGCRQANCALIGGETAELPGVYSKNRCELAGFAVGVAERKKLVDGRRIRHGDKIIGLASSGLHSNGYSLVRRLADMGKLTLSKELLTPTRIYVRPVLKILEKYPINGLAHITGGGLLDNIPRILPAKREAAIFSGSWPIPPVFSLLAGAGRIKESEMFRTFNMGIGYVIIVPSGQEKKIMRTLNRLGEASFLIGEIKKGRRRVLIA